MTQPITNSGNKRVRAKERKLRTIHGWYACPACGEDSDTYEGTLVGEVHECMCGAMVEIVK